jgi:hypothetical protein
LVCELQEIVILASRSEQIHTRRDARLSTVDIQILMERHRVTTDSNTMLRIIVDALDGTVASTSLGIGADSLVRETSRVLAGSTSLDVLDRVGEGIEYNRSLLGHTSMTSCAELGRQLWVDFRSLADLLSSNDSKQSRKSEDRRHCCEMIVILFLMQAIYPSGKLSYIIFRNHNELTISAPYSAPGRFASI